MDASNFHNYCYIGMKGWTGEHLKRDFYPAEMKPSQYLKYYCSQFNMVEVPSTSGSLPHSATLDTWYFNTPPGFLFCPYLPLDKLERKSAKRNIERFMDQMTLLRKKLGPIVIDLAGSRSESEAEEIGKLLADLPDSCRYVIAGNTDRNFIKIMRESLRGKDVTVAKVMSSRENESRPTNASFVYCYVVLEEHTGKKVAQDTGRKIAKMACDIISEKKEVFVVFEETGYEAIKLVRENMLKNLGQCTAPGLN